MPFTLIYSLFALVFLAIIFILAYKFKGLKFALVSVLILFILALGFLFLLIFLITSAMN